MIFFRPLFGDGTYTHGIGLQGLETRLRLSMTMTTSPSAHLLWTPARGRIARCTLYPLLTSCLLSGATKIPVMCLVAVPALRCHLLLALGVGVGALAAFDPSSVPSAAIRLLQVTPSLDKGLNGIYLHYQSHSTLSGLFLLSPASSITVSLNPSPPTTR